MEHLTVGDGRVLHRVMVYHRVHQFFGDPGVIPGSYTHLDVYKRQPTDLLPDGLKEGDVLEEQEGRFLRDEQGTEARRTEIRKKLMDLFD